MDKTQNFYSGCQEDPDNHKSAGRLSDKSIHELVGRMNRIEGQIRGIKGMIERQVYCDDILNQITSVQSALHGAAKLLLEKQISLCIAEQLRNGDEKTVDETVKNIFKLIK